MRPNKTGKARPVLVGASVLATALAVELVDELADGAKSAALPLIREGLGLSYGQIGLLESAPLLLGSIMELPLGILAGHGRRRRRAVLLGGAAGVFVGPAALDLPLTFEGVRAAGATLGSGVVLVLDDTVSVPSLLRRITRFFRDESCGQCVPCRVGTVRQEELLQRLRAGHLIGDRDEELALLSEIDQVMRDASICGLGQTASSAISSVVHGPLSVVGLPDIRVSEQRTTDNGQRTKGQGTKGQ